MPPALLFDLDGTIVHSAPGIAETINGVLAGLGRPTLPVEEVTDFIGDGAPVLFDRAIAASGPPLPEAEHLALQRHYVTLLSARRHVPEDLYPGVAETLRALAAEGRRMALVTNKPQGALALMLADLGLEGVFGTAIGGDGPAGRKPAPGPLFAALAALGMPDGPAIMIGDSGTDVAAARAAGARIVVVSYGYSHQPPGTLGADRLVDRFDAVPEAIAGL
jgi:phosphoglycolate phosphatase